MLVLAHRGYHQHVPENTLEAFEAAAKLGVDGFETDLRLSADGRIVLFHDRLAPDGRLVADLTRDELSSVAGYEVPTAEQALEQFPEFLWNLEIKTPLAGDAAAPLLRRYADQRRLLVTSFWHNVISAMRGRVKVPYGLLEAERPLTLSPLLPGSPRGVIRSDAVTTVVWSFEMIDRELLSLTASQGVDNWAYGLQTPDDHRRAAELKLRAIITDRPEWAVRT